MKYQIFNKRKVFRFKRFTRKTYAVFNSMHKLVNTGVIAICMLTFTHVSSQAQTHEIQTLSSEKDLEHELEEVIITASKAELTLNQTVKIFRVITREEVERQAVQSIQDLLKNVAGVDVRQRGSQGVLAGISMRGGTFEQTATLLNGVNLTNPQTAHYNLDIPVNLSDIERIEIIQGPTSLLYGAGAFSGGVNIVTKKDSDTGVLLNVEGGMHALRGANVRGSLKTASANHSLSAGYSAADGYMNNSDFKLFNVLWQSNFRTNVSQLDVLFGLNDKAYGANTFYSAAYPNQFDDTRSIFAAIKGEAGTMLKFIPQLYWSRHYDTFHLFRPGTLNIPDSYTAPNDHRTDVFGFNLNLQYKWTGGITNFGGELRNEGILSSNLGRDSIYNRGNYKLTDNRSNISYFLEHTCLYHSFTLNIGLLANYNTAFKEDSGLYPHVNAAYRLTDRFKVFASWSKATRIPTFTDLYYKGKTHEGNSDVQPEKSEALEVGVDYKHSFVSAYFNVYYMKGHNLIDWVKLNPDDKWQSRNFTGLNKKGFEAGCSFRLKEFVSILSDARLDLGYMYLYQDKDAGNWISNYVLDHLRHKFTTGLSHPIYRKLSADWRFRWQQREGSYTQYENNVATGKEVAYPAFSLLDVKLNWRRNRLQVHLTVNNLLNVTYYDLGNLPQPGFWLMGGVAYDIR
jgi:iron complex outermembrane receptor protein